MSTEIQEKKPPGIKEILNSDKMSDQIAKALPSQLDVTRVVRITTTALTKTPKLTQCTPESFFRCLLDLSAMGLEPDGRNAYLIPRDNKKKGITECTLLIDFKGYIKLMRGSGAITDIHADVVCENDEFSFAHGSGKHLTHKPALNDRGKAIAAYSFVHLTNGDFSFDVLDIGEIEKARKSAGTQDIWRDHWHEMAKKTAIRRHQKTLDISPQLQDAIEIEERQAIGREITTPERVVEASEIAENDLPAFLNTSDKPEESEA